MSWLVTADQWEPRGRAAATVWHRLRARAAWRGVRWNASAASSTGVATTARPPFCMSTALTCTRSFTVFPTWCRADKDQRAAPDDLRDVYRFAQALATQFRGRVQAWEAWNEPDIFFLLASVRRVCGVPESRVSRLPIGGSGAARAGPLDGLRCRRIFRRPAGERCWASTWTSGTTTCTPIRRLTPAAARDSWRSSRATTSWFPIG